MAPAVRKNAAEEISPGTSMLHARSASGAWTATRQPSCSTCTPIARSIRSVWSREGAGSTTSVTPSAYSPASRIALLSCADATGISYRTPCSAAGAICSGQYFPSRPRMSAPISRSGVMIRPIGRCSMDASPVMETGKGCAARMPESSRVVVPLLPV